MLEENTNEGPFKVLSVIYFQNCDMRFLVVKISPLLCFLGIAVPVFSYENIQLGHELYGHYQIVAY